MLGHKLNFKSDAANSTEALLLDVSTPLFETATVITPVSCRGAMHDIKDDVKNRARTAKSLKTQLRRAPVSKFWPATETT
jgi:hypothetical protein